MATFRGTAGWQAKAALAGVSRHLHPGNWAYALPGSRDLRLDLIRGFLVVAMVVDHIGGNSWLNAISGNNAFVVSAAEGFVFVSGALMGIVYGKRALKQGVGSGMKALLSRAWFLYLVTTALTLASLGLTLFTEVPMFYDRAAGLGVWSPLEAIVGTLTLHYAYNGTDVLAIYVQLAAVAPLVLYLLVSGRTPLVLAASWLLWGAYQVYPAETELWPIRNSIFPFAAWQLLFYNGMALGFHREAVARRLALLRGTPALLGLGAGVAVLVLLVRLHDTGEWVTLGLPAVDPAQWNLAFSKSPLGVGRVAAFALIALFVHALVTRAWTPFNVAGGWLLRPLGQSALVAYGAHLFFIGPVQETFLDTLYGSNYSIWAATLVHGIALLGLLLFVHFMGQRTAAMALTRRWLGELEYWVVAPAVCRVSSGPQCEGRLRGRIH